MEQININTAPAEPVVEETEVEHPDGTVVRRREVNQGQTSIEAGGVTVNVPNKPGTTNVNVNG